MDKKKEISERLKSFIGIAEQLKNSPPLPKEYWEKEQKVIEDMQKQAEYEKKLITMSYEKLHKPFTI